MRPRPQPVAAVRISLFLSALALLASVEHSRADDPQAVQACSDAALHGDFDRTLSTCSNALDAPKLSIEERAEIFNSRGSAYFRRDDLGHARLDFDRAIELVPDYPVARSNRGALLARLGFYKGAIAELDEAIRLQPDFSHAYINRGLAHSGAGDKALAVRDYSEAIRLDPDNAAALRLR